MKDTNRARILILAAVLVLFRAYPSKGAALDSIQMGSLSGVSSQIKLSSSTARVESGLEIISPSVIVSLGLIKANNQSELQSQAREQIRTCQQMALAALNDPLLTFELQVTNALSTATRNLFTGRKFQSGTSSSFSGSNLKCTLTRISP